jgi:hypothetical protein
MSTDDPTPPVADDDFPEFAEPPRHRPPAEQLKPRKQAEPGEDEAQAQVDDVIARLRRERAERERP